MVLKTPTETQKQVFIGVGVLALLVAGVLAWSGYARLSGQRTAEALLVARDALVETTEQALGRQARKLGAKLEAADVQAALAANDADALDKALREGWAGVVRTQRLGADLNAAYADPAAFGYAKLGLLETALRDDRPAVRVVREDGRNALGVAAPAAEGTVLVYVQLPLASITGELHNASLPEAGYLALRQGNFTLAERGADALKSLADRDSRPVGGSERLRVAAAYPEYAPGGFGRLVTAGVLFVLAVLLLLLGFDKLKLPRRRQRKAEPEDDSPVLASVLQQQDAAPEATASTLAAADADTDADADADAEDPAAAPLPVVPPAPEEPVEVDAGIFRAYDIRGVVGAELTPRVAELIGLAIGSVLEENALEDIVVGRDGRLSGPELSAGLIDGLRKAGCNVIDIGMVPTPVAYFAAYHLRAGSCVSVTGSHNPPDHNGFKVVVGGQTLSGDTITDLYRRISENRLHVSAVRGGLSQRDVAADYIDRISADVQLDRPLKVVVDAGNGVAGGIAPRLLQAIGAEVVELYCEVDGNFPNHHPDPSEPHNLVDLIATVQRTEADIGVAFDGDGDRLGVVTREGEVIFPDRLLMLFAADVLERNPGAQILYDVKCTGKLQPWILRHGGAPLMWKTGHSLMKAKMRETSAELAGEMSGHFFFSERWYGFDDGLYAAARLLEILARRHESPSETLAQLPRSVSTPEIKLPVPGGDPHARVATFLEKANFFGNPQLTTLDGLRVDWDYGWGLLRASNTTPVLVLRFEGDDEAALERIKADFRAQMQLIMPDVVPTF